MRFFIAALSLLVPLQGFAETKATSEAAPTPVKLVAIAPRADAITRTFYGRVTARSTVDLAFQAGGQIAELPVTEGTVVAKGELLAQLDLDPFRRDLARAQATLEQARRDYARREALGADTTPQAQIDAARTDAELAAVAVADAEAALEDATLLAPFDSLVALREAEQFATVSPGQTIVRIHDMSELRVAIEVPELLVRQVGADPEISAESDLGTGAEPVSLAFRELTAEASDVGQTFRLTLAFTGPVPQRLLPGASVTVRLTLTRRGAEARTLVPVGAVRYAADGTPQVLVFDPEGIVSAQPVEIGPGPEGQFELIEGPEPGSQIVAAGAARLSDGARVRRYDGLLDERGEQ